jgi:2-keto-3-deoxy-L-rhamnonate aldolase RhmA
MAMAHPTFVRCATQAKPVFGTMVTYDALDAVELQSQIGPDFIVIDCQHTLITEDSTQRLLYGAQNSNVATMVRVSSLDPAKIGAVADAGADAVIIPMVSTAEEARTAVEACRYGTRGSRSLGPLRRSLVADPRMLEERISCFAMIETAEAITNLDAICATEGLAGVYLGSADLSLSLNEPLFVLPSLPFLRDIDRKIVAACRSNGIIAGTHAGPMMRTKELIDDGFQLLTLGLDWIYVANGIKSELAEVNAYLDSK